MLWRRDRQHAPRAHRRASRRAAAAKVRDTPSMGGVVASVSLGVAAVIHLLPVAGVFGQDRLAALYGVALTDSNLVIMMRHRAVLFGLLGLFLLTAAIWEEWQPPAIAAGGISALSFALLAHREGRFNQHLQRVLVADYVAIAALGLAAAARGWDSR